MSDDGLRQFEFTEDQDWVRHRVPNYPALIEPYVGQPIRAIEVGCWEGRSAIWWLDNLLTHEHSTLTLIDPSRGPVQHRRLLHNISQHPDSHKVWYVRSSSHHILPNLPEDHYDFIYIDGSHEGKDVLLDACLAFRKLKPGGTLLFDDYLWQGHPHYNHHVLPEEPLKMFVKTHEHLLDVVLDNYQMAVRRKM